VVIKPIDRESPPIVGEGEPLPGSRAVGFAAVRRRAVGLLDCGFRRREWKPATLVAGFLLLTVGVLLGLALAVGGLISSSIRAEALRGAEQSAEVFLYIGLEPDDYEGGRLRQRSYRELDENVRQSQAVVGARLWDAHTRLLHESGASRSGAPAKATAALRSAFRDGVRSELAPGRGSGNEVRTYLPLPTGKHGPARQVLELRVAGERVASEISIRRRRLYVILFGAASLLCLALLPTVLKGSRALAERYRSAHLGLQRELRRALHRDELVLHYQPKLDLRTGRVYGVEALLRWNHPRRGMVPPLEFLPAAEETSLALPLTIRVFELALARLATWRREGLDLSVAINVAPAVLAEPELPRQIQRLLGKHGVRAGDVTLEITESAIGQAPVLPALTQLRSLGFELSIDDFGTGHSSLVRLDTLPIDELKIDRSFINKLAAGGASTLVTAMIRLAHELGLCVVAEGVETQAITQTLADLGCDSIQGYHLARPLPEADVPSWLRSAQAAQKARPPALSGPIGR
jgi:EAL domain-containing protein (putative c-di-GMP-specific phosphodiesterase class I)